MLKFFKFVNELITNFAYFILGLIFLTGLTIFVIFSLPFYIYRWMVCQVIAPVCKKDLGKAVAAVSSGFATELIDEKSRMRPRGAIIINVALEGTVTPEKLRNIVQQGLLTVENSERGDLKFPELQQYIGTWMGYQFWRPDKSFDLQNHLVHHKCGENWTDAECEQFAQSIAEDLLNKPFPINRSPWEIHIIHGYRDSALSGDKEMTMAVSRFHHCIADGFGLLSLVCEGLLGKSVADCGIPMLEKAISSKVSIQHDNSNSLAKKLKLVSLPIRAIRDVGYGAFIVLFPTRTSWYIPDSKQTGRHFYDKSGYLPISKIKFIKNKLGVSFTAVLLSSIAAGIANAFKSKGHSNRIKSVPFLSPLPRSAHPYKLRNHVTAALYELPVGQTLSPLQRLKESENQIHIAKNSVVPFFAILILKLFSSQIPCIAKFFLTNRTLSTALSSFPGPGNKLAAHGLTAVSADFVAGLQLGVIGVGFMTLSYCDHIRIGVVAENAAISDRKELKELIRAVTAEIDALYDLAIGKEDVTRICTDGDSLV